MGDNKQNKTLFKALKNFFFETPEPNLIVT